MAKQDIEATEYNWDDGTYQTGATPDRKGQSAVITGLLITTIFLGSIASALGLMNVQLLHQLVQQESPVLPVAVDDEGMMDNSFLREQPEQGPEVPENANLQLQVSCEPQGVSQQPASHAVTARLTVIDNQGREKNGKALILSSDGYLLTNAHLTDSARSITAQLPDGQALRAALVACDPYSDLAVVYVQAQGLSAAAFAAEASEAEGSFLKEESAGPVFLADGRVLGFLCRTFEGEDSQLILSSQLTDIITQLVEKGCVSGRPCLGLQTAELSAFCRQYWNLEYGLEITKTQVEDLLVGDILLSINGQRLTTCHQLYRLLDAQVGQSVTLEIFRAGTFFTITLPVITNP